MAEQWTSEMLNQLASVVQENSKQIARNGEQIARNGEQIARNGEQIARNGEQIARNDEQIARNDEQLVEIGKQVAENSKQIAANTAAIQDMRIMMNELREGQALLTQIFQEEQEAFREFRRLTNAALDRIDRTLERLERDRS